MRGPADAGEGGARSDRGCSEARQGHLYDHNGNDVIALSSGAIARVVYIDPTWEWCSPPFHVDATELVPLPMKYYHGEIPR